MKMVSDTLISMIIFCGIGGLLFFIFGIFVKYSPKNKVNVAKLEVMKNEMLNISIQQFEMLNCMYINYSINLKRYNFEIH